MRPEREGERVRLITRGGYDWARRYPSIDEAARKNRQSRFVIGGEVIIRGVDGVERLAVAVGAGTSSVTVGGEAWMTGGGFIGTSGAIGGGDESSAVGRGDETPALDGLLHHRLRPVE